MSQDMNRRKFVRAATLGIAAGAAGPVAIREAGAVTFSEGAPWVYTPQLCSSGSHL